MPKQRANMPSPPSFPARGKIRLRHGMSPHKTMPGPGRGDLDCFIHVRWAKSHRHAKPDTVRQPTAPTTQTQKNGRCELSPNQSRKAGRRGRDAANGIITREPADAGNKRSQRSLIFIHLRPRPALPQSIDRFSVRSLQPDARFVCATWSQGGERSTYRLARGPAEARTSSGGSQDAASMTSFSSNTKVAGSVRL